jgi:hypothetical protein
MGYTGKMQPGPFKRNFYSALSTLKPDFQTEIEETVIKTHPSRGPLEDLIEQYRRESAEQKCKVTAEGFAASPTFAPIRNAPEDVAAERRAALIKKFEATVRTETNYLAKAFLEAIVQELRER